MKSKERNSSIEILKLIAMFLIVISHTIPRYGNFESCIDFTQARGGLVNYILYVFHYFGQIGNSVFIVSSSWFLCESNVVKKNKIVHIYVDTFLISIIWLLIVVTLGFNPSLKDILKSFLPVFFRNNWFVTCYIVFYILHPFLNKIISQINQRKHFEIMVLSFGYAFLATLWSQAYFYTDAMGFIIIYFIVSYMKKYMNKFINNIKLNIKILIVSSIMLLFLIKITQLIGVNFAFSNQMLRWNCFINPLIIIMGVTAFNIFNSVSFENNIINKIMSVSLLIYIIHENLVLNDTIKPFIWQCIYENYGYGLILLFVLGLSIIFYCMSTVIALFYKHTLSLRIYAFTDKMFKKTEAAFDKFIVYFVSTK